MFLIASVLLTVGAEAANIELRNEYIRIVVNDRDTDKGRFAVGTTGVTRTETPIRTSI